VFVCSLFWVEDIDTVFVLSVLFLLDLSKGYTLFTLSFEIRRIDIADLDGMFLHSVCIVCMTGGKL
jgi:hypothetical protein